MTKPARTRFFTAAWGGIVVFCVVVLALAVISYRQYARSYRAEADTRLATIAETKATEIAGWRREIFFGWCAEQFSEKRFQNVCPDLIAFEIEMQ